MNKKYKEKISAFIRMLRTELLEFNKWNDINSNSLSDALIKKCIKTWTELGELKSDLRGILSKKYYRTRRYYPKTFDGGNGRRKQE